MQHLTDFLCEYLWVIYIFVENDIAAWIYIIFVKIAMQASNDYAFVCIMLICAGWVGEIHWIFMCPAIFQFRF